MYERVHMQFSICRKPTFSYKLLFIKCFSCIRGLQLTSANRTFTQLCLRTYICLSVCMYVCTCTYMCTLIAIQTRLIFSKFSYKQISCTFITVFIYFFFHFFICLFAYTHTYVRDYKCTCWRSPAVYGLGLRCGVMQMFFTVFLLDNLFSVRNSAHRVQLL